MDRLLSMRVFRQVADSGGFAGAARELEMSPAVVTRLVADLEAHLGARLLQRTTRRMALTDAGEAYLTRVRAILQDIDDAEAVVSAQNQEMRGVLRIQAPPVLAVHVLAPVIAGFRALHPGVVLDIDVDAPNDPRLEDHDITLLATNVDFDAAIIARPLIQSFGVLVATPEYLVQRPALAHPQDLAQHDCLRIKAAGPKPASWRLLHETEQDRAVDVSVMPVLWVNHIDTLLKAVTDGAGIAAMPIELVGPALSAKTLVRVLPEWITGRYTLYAAMPSRRFVPLRTRVFLDYLSIQIRAGVAELGV
jgi:DNA-binding transcriptional LysR family regulator